MREWLSYSIPRRELKIYPSALNELPGRTIVSPWFLWRGRGIESASINL